jgi:integrase
MRLNEEVVKSLPAPPVGNKVHFFPDAVILGSKTPRGFGVQVTAKGVRSFVLRYRANHRERQLTIGRHGDWTVFEAVKEARALRQRVDRGEDPLEERRKHETASENTFKAICEDFFRRDGASLRTGDRRKSDLERLAYPQLADRPIEDIRRTDIIRLLDDVADDHGPVMADRLLAYIRKVMNWHATRSDEYRSPIVKGMARTSGKERARKRILSDVELRAVWSAAEASTAPFCRLVQFLLLTGARRSEAAEMPWGELNGSTWTLAAVRNKTKLDLVRPLSKMALAALPQRGASEFVFTINGRNPIVAFADFQPVLYRASGTSGWTIHDLRRTARSLMGRAGVPTDHAERCLGHVIGGVRGVYDRYEYFNEKAEAYEKLASVIEHVVCPQDNVGELRRAL